MMIGLRETQPSGTTFLSPKLNVLLVVPCLAGYLENLICDRLQDGILAQTRVHTRVLSKVQKVMFCVLLAAALLAPLVAAYDNGVARLPPMGCVFESDHHSWIQRVWHDHLVTGQCGQICCESHFTALIFYMQLEHVVH